MATTLTGPATERRSAIDALRGLALFGVVIMNVTSFVIVARIPEIFTSETPAGFMTSYAGLVFLGGKARSIFALLFGVGFAILLAGQILLGTARAFNSGTDTALLYQSLAADTK